MLLYLTVFGNRQNYIEKLSKMYEQLRIHDKMQKEFIDVAAHELRTPIQPILGLTEILRSKITR